jgi:hypothetical protein
VIENTSSVDPPVAHGQLPADVPDVEVAWFDSGGRRSMSVGVMMECMRAPRRKNGGDNKSYTLAAIN